MVAGLKVNRLEVDAQLARRQKGPGRGGRMKIEKDKVRILSGLRNEKTIGSPIAVQIKNKDFSINRLAAVSKPRPGHADLAGALKFGTHDVRDCLERSSARETAARVAVGSICRILLKKFGIKVASKVLALGCIELRGAQSAKDVKDMIKEARKAGDTLGGVFEVAASGVPAGLGSYVQHDRKLDGRLAAAVMSIQAVKAVEIGAAFENSMKFGSEVHDIIFYTKSSGFSHVTNNAGGLEGGVTNGEPVIVRGYMKPIATLSAPLESVDLKTKKPVRASVQRHDTCAVEACGVVAEAGVCFEIANAILEKFGGDSLTETRRNYDAYLKACRKF